jgi:hypothetical protein
MKASLQVTNLAFFQGYAAHAVALVDLNNMSNAIPIA